MKIFTRVKYIPTSIKSILFLLNVTLLHYIKSCYNLLSNHLNDLEAAESGFSIVTIVTKEQMLSKFLQMRLNV